MIGSLSRAAKPVRIRSNTLAHTHTHSTENLEPTSTEIADEASITQAQELKTLHQELASTEFVPNEVIVKMSASPQALASLTSELGAKIAEKFDFPSSSQEVVRLQLPSNMDLAETLLALRKDQRVSYAEPNQIVQLQGVQEGLPNDLAPQLWGLSNTGQTGGTKGADINAPGAWKVHTGDWATAPLVAVLDTGVDYTHSDLKANIWKNKGEIPNDGIDNDENGVIDDVYGYNANEDNGDPMDVHGHGTHCAGTIGAVGNNSNGVVGVSWKANIMPVRIFNSQGAASADSIIRGILYAAKMKAEVTNNSWVSLLPNEAIKEAFASSDAIHVAAAGNNNYDTDRRPLYPMGFDLPNIISVGASDHNDEKAEFSNYGARTVDVTAPGKDIYSTKPGESYQFMSGTSMATPHVTGLVSLIKDAHPNLSNQQVMDRVFYSSDPVDALSEVSASGGRINAAKAVEDDHTAPAAPRDFKAVETASREVMMGWTATGDDGWCGDGVAYELYVSDKPLTEENLPRLKPATVGRVSSVGELERIPLSFGADETRDRTFHSALRLVDNVGLRSQTQTTDFVVPAARLHFGQEHSGWNPEGSWQQLDVAGRTQVWCTNPPDGQYGENLSMSLTTPIIDLGNAKKSMLTYEAKYDLLPGDAVFVEVTADGGESWKSVRAMSRRSGDDWRYSEVDLSRYDGEHVQLRFRLRTDEEGGSWGAQVANMRLLSD